MSEGSHQLGVVVVAAGAGTRMRSALPKVLHPICGRSLLGHVLAVADALAPAHTVVVLAPDTVAQVRAGFGERYTYVVQAERLGTGHAVLQAEPALRNKVDDVLVLYGDTPLVRTTTAREVLDLRRERAALLSLMSFHAHPPSGYGRVLRDATGQVSGLIEERDATPEQRAISEGNSGIMSFAAVWQTLPRVPRNPIKGEYYLTDLVALAVDERGPGAAVALAAGDEREAWGINDRVQLAEAEAVLRQRILAALMRDGVTVADPATTYVDVGVLVGADTLLLPGTLLCGATQVGAGCEIGPHTMIVDATIGAGARIRHALIERAVIPNEAVIGPFAHIVG
jgi:bifunctional UDP-N-acetylglucosamine pyrophosphorylase / glucosamine-1-phosphate N-acetyltransferase